MKKRNGLDTLIEAAKHLELEMQRNSSVESISSLNTELTLGSTLESSNSDPPTKTKNNHTKSRKGSKQTTRIQPSRTTKVEIDHSLFAQKPNHPTLLQHFQMYHMLIEQQKEGLDTQEELQQVSKNMKRDLLVLKENS